MKIYESKEKFLLRSLKTPTKSILERCICVAKSSKKRICKSENHKLLTNNEFLSLTNVKNKNRLFLNKNNDFKFKTIRKISDKNFNGISSYLKFLSIARKKYKKLKNFDVNKISK